MKTEKQILEPDIIIGNFCSTGKHKDVINKAGKSIRYYQFTCICGSIGWRQLGRLKKGLPASCGCLRYNQPEGLTKVEFDYIRFCKLHNLKFDHDNKKIDNKKYVVKSGRLFFKKSGVDIMKFYQDKKSLQFKDEKVSKITGDYKISW